ncbi:MBL fold metallo-hydrolase [soil metagenome]
MGRGEHPRLSVWCYRLGATLIDAGTVSALEAFLPVLLADGPVRHIYLTHHHEDHSGGVVRVRDLTGAHITVSQFAAPLLRGGFRLHLYQQFYWGRFAPFEPDETLQLPPLGALPWSTPDGDFVLLHAPGHSHDMTVVWDAARGALFAADLYLAARLKLMRRDEVWSALQASLARLLDQTEFDALYCAHRPVLSGGFVALQKKHAWMLESREHLEAERAAGKRVTEAAETVFDRSNRVLERVSFGDLSRGNMAASALGDLKPRPDVVGAVGDAVARCRF